MALILWTPPPPLDGTDRHKVTHTPEYSRVDLLKTERFCI